MRLREYLLVGLTGLVAGLAVLGVVLILDRAENEQYQAHLRTLVREQVSSLRASMERALNSQFIPIENLEVLVRARPAFTQTGFEAVADVILRERDDIRAVALAPELKVTHVHPAENNGWLVGRDLATDSQRAPMIQRTVDTGRFHLAGPREAPDGGRVLYGRLPISVPSMQGDGYRLWGLAIIVVDFKAFLDSVGWGNEDGRVRMAVRGRDGQGADGGVFLGDAAIFRHDPITAEVTFPNGAWQVAAMPEGGWAAERPSAWVSRLIGGLFALVAAIGAGALAAFILLQRKTQQSLQEAKAEAERASLAKSQFVAQMSHDLRTPLNAIIGFSEVMAEEMLGPHSVPKYRDYAQDIRKSGQHLLDLVNTLLDLKKIEAGKFEIHPQPVDLAALIHEGLGLLEQKAEAHGVHLVDGVPQGLPPVEVDQRAFRQVLFNLLSNAVKFTGEGGTVTATARLLNNGGLALSIIDEGVGMSEHDVAYALSEFGQVNNAFVAKEEGTGLGMPLAKSITELHDGGFQVASTPGEGTRVTITLPPARVLEAQETTADDPPARVAS